MAFFKDLIVTGIIGAVLGEGFLRLASALDLPIPLHEAKRPVFLVGILLFSLAFRLLMALKDKPEGPLNS